MNKCKLCSNKPVHEKGYFNFAAIFYPLCPEHMKEYEEFKKRYI